MKKSHISLVGMSIAALLTLGAGCTSTTTTTTNTVKPKNTNVVNTNTAAVTFITNVSEAAIKADVNGQWANTATASTEYGTDSWSAKQATGVSDVTTYADNGNAWAPSKQNKGAETLELSYVKAVSAVGVRIHETYGAGMVTKVELKDADGVYHTAWEGKDSTSGIGYLQIPVETATYKTNGVKITFDTTVVPAEWAEVDAVQLVGK